MAFCSLGGPDVQDKTGTASTADSTSRHERYNSIAEHGQSEENHPEESRQWRNGNVIGANILLKFIFANTISKMNSKSLHTWALWSAVAYIE